MKNSKSIIKTVSTTLLFVIISLLVPIQVPANFYGNKERAAEFSLKDQFGTTYDYTFPRAKISVLAFSDKEGAEQLEDWIRPLFEKYQDRIDIRGVAELSAVPSLARGIVRGMIKKKSKHPVMLDWKGEVSRNYKYQKEVANIVLINQDGLIVTREIGSADAGRLDKFYREIDALLK